MRIVLTGATGFLGQALTTLLLDEGHAVCVLVRPDSRKEKLPHGQHLSVIRYTSLSSPETLQQLQSWQPEAMVHLAWKGVGGKERSEADQFTANIPLTLDCINLAYNAGCQHWIGIGSQAEYGIPNREVVEADTCHPVTAYGKAKLATGIASLGLCEALKIKGTWCRVFSVYGPGDHPGTLLSYIISSLQTGDAPSLTACEQEWDYLYITDAAAAIAALLKKGCTGIYNIASGKTVVLKNVVEMIREEMGTETAVKYGERPYTLQQVMHLQGNVDKLKNDTGWQPAVSLKEGLQQTILLVQKPVAE
jgi:nucleoside-diphosphate-sugar epimerase